MAVKKSVSLEKVVAEDFYDLKFVLDPQISPDGNTVAFVKQHSTLDTLGYQSSICLTDTDGKNTRRFTSGSKRDHSPRWSPDGKKILFVSNREGRPQLWMISVDGGEARQLTYLWNGASNPEWSKDGKKILFLSRINIEERQAETKNGIKNEPLSSKEIEKLEREWQKEEAEKADPRWIERTIYRAGKEYFDDRNSHIYVIELTTSEIKRLTRADRNHINPHWSPSGKFVYCAAKKTGSDDDTFTYDLLRIPSDGGVAKSLTQANSWGLNPIPSPDGKQIAFLNVDEYHGAAQNAQLLVVNSNGQGQKRLLESLDADILQIEWSNDSKKIYFTTPQDGDVGLYSVSVKSNQKKQHIKGTRMVRAFSLSDSNQVAFLNATPQYPCDIFTCDASGAKEKRLTNANADFLNRKQVQPVEEMIYKSKDGTKIQGWVIKPPNFSTKKKYPLAVEIHGGPHVMWSNSETTMFHEWQMLASAGYVVFFSNPRGSDGYGFKFKDAIHADWGTYPTEDILSGVDKLVDRGYIDTKKICVTGGSYGGYMTAWLVGHDKRFAAAVSQRGVYDLLSFYGTTDVPRLIEWEYDTNPWEDPMKLWEASPIAYAKNIRTPLLILHSDNDFRAPVPSAEGMYMALRKLKRNVKFVRFPNEGHELSRSGQPKRLVSRLNHILDWFNDNIKKK